MDSIIDRLAETELKYDSEIVDPIHLEDSLERMATDGDIQPAEQEGLDRLLKDALTGKTFTVGFLRRVNARLATVYAEVHNAPLRNTASRSVAAVDDVVFARSTGEAGRVIAVIGTGSPSYQDTVKEYQKRYGWKQSIAVDNALALYKVVHADGHEELYFDTETTADSSYVHVPEASQEKEAVLVDSNILKEALNLWWSLLPESERALQFSRHGSDLKILDRLQTKLAEEREETLSEIHPMLSTAYSHVKANGLSKKAGLGTKKAELEPEDIPEDFEVQPLKSGEEAEYKATCGTCGLSWDDGKVTSMTPAPSARCPFETFHEEGEPDTESPEAIAESFINGNISWVKEQIGGDLDKFMAVMDILGYGSEEGRSFQRIMRKGSAKVADGESKGKDKKLAVWHLNKMVQPWGPEGADPTQTRDFGDLESGNVLIASEEELLKSIEQRFGLTGWQAVEDEPGRYSTNLIENNDGMPDESGNWIADYDLYVEWYIPAKGA